MQMRRRNRSRQRDERPVGSNDAASEGRQTEELRDRAERLLDAGDDIVRRALSGNSQRFLAQNRQQGGQ
jgi:hypothetical protein